MASIQTIRAKLDRLRAVDPQFKLFGADTHRYKLDATLTGAQIEAFEQSQGIKLPDGYRTFLMELGNGGAGPGYGMLPLGFHPKYMTNLPPDLLARPFQHREAWHPQITSAADDEWYCADHWIQGTVHLCHFGCGYYALLVVSGAEYGQIWNDDRSSDEGIYPDPSGDFLTWYEDWLDATEDEARTDLQRYCREGNVSMVGQHYRNIADLDIDAVIAELQDNGLSQHGCTSVLVEVFVLDREYASYLVKAHPSWSGTT